MGYKGMLRDRCPDVVNYALKWQKAKERWINHAYKNFIRIYTDNNERYHATRITLGIAKYYRNFEFDKSIDWDNCTDEEIIFWQRVSSWVQWFKKHYASIKKMYITSVESGKDEQTIKVNIVLKWLGSLLPTEDSTEEEKQAKYKYVDDLVDFLIKCFKHG